MAEGRSPSLRNVKGTIDPPTMVLSRPEGSSGERLHRGGHARPDELTVLCAGSFNS
jgi:hypothetical protein